MRCCGESTNESIGRDVSNRGQAGVEGLGMIAALFFVVVVGVVFWSEVAVQGVVFEREVRASKADAVAVFDVANQEQGHIGDFLSSPLRQLGSVGVG